MSNILDLPHQHDFRYYKLYGQRWKLCCSCKKAWAWGRFHGHTKWLKVKNPKVLLKTIQTKFAKPIAYRPSCEPHSSFINLLPDSYKIPTFNTESRYH